MTARKRFESWLDGCGRPRVAIARELAVNSAVITRLANGERKPGRDLAVRIETLTGGAVRVADWSAPA